MTLHVYYSHQCTACEAHYIPYDQDVPCPQCGLIKPERFDFIPRALQSMEFNLKQFGSYMPPAWWVGSLGDHVLHLLFRIFDAHADWTEPSDFEGFLDTALGIFQWGEHPYMKEHIRAIALRVHAALESG
jgi:hypothetical protein